MKRIISLIVGVVAMLALAISPAVAHWSSYIGHGRDGTFQYVSFNGTWDGCDWTWDPTWGSRWFCGHWHRYFHTSGPVAQGHECWMFVAEHREGWGNPVNWYWNPYPNCY